MCDAELVEEEDGGADLGCNLFSASLGNCETPIR
jgi:hypothetical protein